MEDEVQKTTPTMDAVNFALTGKPVEFAAAVKELMADKTYAAVEAHREVVARNTFAGQEPEAEPEAEESAEVETTDEPTEESEEETGEE